MEYGAHDDRDLVLENLGNRRVWGGGCGGSSTGQFCDTDNQHSGLVATATGQAKIDVPAVEIAVSICLPFY